MKKKGLALVIGISMALVLVVAVGVFFGGAEDARTKRLKTLQVPAAGPALFGFLLREIPDVVSQVPCSCCSEVLEGCYQGACPPS